MFGGKDTGVCKAYREHTGAAARFGTPTAIKLSHGAQNPLAWTAPRGGGRTQASLKGPLALAPRSPTAVGSTARPGGRQGVAVRMCVVYSEYILLLVYTGIYWYILIGLFPHTPVYTTYIPVEYLFSFNIKSPQP